MDLWKGAAFGAAIVLLAGCQTTSEKMADDATLQVAGRLQAVPLLMERCELVDPANRAAYAAERARYQEENRWVSDAVYKVFARRVASTRDGLEAFVRGTGQKRIDDIFAPIPPDKAKGACLKALAQCRTNDPSCWPIDQALPEQVRQVVSEAAKG